MGAAAALATLKIFEQEKTLEQLKEKAALLAELLEPFRDYPNVGDVRQRGLIAAIELVENKRHKTPYAWAERRGGQVCDRAIERGVWLRPLGNVIPLIPPLSISMDEIRYLCGVLAESLVDE